MTITIPPNNNGSGYVCYSRAGFGAGFGEPQEQTAFEDLATQVQRSGGALNVSVIGPLLLPPETVQVRKFTALQASDL